MTTRSQAETLLPLTDPEAILKNSRRQKRLEAAATIQHDADDQSNLFNLPALPPSPTMSEAPETSNTIDPSKNNANTTGTSLTLDDYLKGILKLQHQSIDQANVDRGTIMESLKCERELRQANAHRIAKLEEMVLRLAIKNDPETSSTRVETGRIDLQRFRSSDGPIFLGPFQNVERFITWIRSVQIFFATKGVTHDDDKIQIIGGLIRETNTTAFYANRFEKFLGHPWSEFRSKLIKFALPPNWRTTLRGKFKDLRMANSESFLAYSTRSRTLQSMLNFDLEKEAISDFDLAESMTLGSNAELQSEIHNHQLLLQVPFLFSTFENRASGFWDGVVKQSAGTLKP
ncbi:hypothetical protein PGT21_020497 [Puccinia graminis f. sp. tritici]|uniref:Retrotransposon gag domain-containing protein n=1 Tax=Puccinia graminis f. sp. tritici TaxID=56615 RepID=A0A5B0PD79_PUCGR|nr:hypothetical protein PGT21_020497 [Puccinia graminis f. sp. tritici]